MPRNAVLVLLLALALAGCATPTSTERSGAGDGDPLEPHEAASAPRTVGAFAGEIVVAEAFTVRGTRISVAHADADALGTTAAPVALADAGALARTRLARDHWTLVVDVAERAPRAASLGAYRARLEWNGAEAGVVFLERLPSAGGNATLVFDVGRSLRDSNTYLLAIETADTPATVVEATLETVADLTWKGADGGETNPTIRAPFGAAVRLRVVNADGGYHNLVVLDPDGRVVAGPTRDTAAEGDEDALAWEPSAPATYAYVCRYHAATMRGAIEVA